MPKLPTAKTLTNAPPMNGWRRVKFGDVVECVNDTVADPQAAGVERVVGLDHLDPGSLHIKRWASIEDGTTFTRRFKSGQVLFGKRRAYQRKLAVAEFDGICSGDILVFEPKNDGLSPELLPFIMQTEGFWQHALNTSAGSLSPRTKWQDLARYEFALPPKDEQHRIAEILWAADETIENYKCALHTLADLFSATLAETTKAGRRTNFGELVKLASGERKPDRLSAYSSTNHPHPVFGGNGVIGFAATPLVTEPKIIVGRVGEYCGNVQRSRVSCWVTDNALYVKERQGGVDFDFLYYAMTAANFNRLRKVAGQPLVSQREIYECEVFLPSLREQKEMAARMIHIETVQSGCVIHLDNLGELKRRLISEQFSEDYV